MGTNTTTSATMSGIKLTYFNLKGRAELARLILAQAEVDYEDCRIEREAWAELKTSLPMGQLPVLEVDGQTIGQSISIARYLARRFGLAGKTDLDAAEADQAVDALTDMINSFSPLMKEKEEENRVEDCVWVRDHASLDEDDGDTPDKQGWEALCWQPVDLGRHCYLQQS